MLTNAFFLVLLRLLQTFSGVAFLSTNRVGVFDSGFLSHVNFSLYFPQLGEEQKHLVWEIFRRRAEADFDVDDLKDFSSTLFENRVDMNGREIRNMWETAMSLALYEHQCQSKDDGTSKPILHKRHFETMEQSAAQFRSYLTAALGDRDINPTWDSKQKSTE